MQVKPVNLNALHISLTLYLLLLPILARAQCPADSAVLDKTFGAKDLASWPISDGKLDTDVKADDDRLLFIVSIDAKNPHLRSPDKLIYPTGDMELSVSVQLRFEEDQNAKVYINWMQDGAEDGVTSPMSLSLSTQSQILMKWPNDEKPDVSERAVSSTVYDCKESCSSRNRDDLTNVKVGSDLTDSTGSMSALTGNFNKEGNSFYDSGAETSTPYTVTTLLKESSVAVKGHKADDEDADLLSYGYPTEGRPKLQLDLGPTLSGGLQGSSQFLSIMSVTIKGCRALSQEEINAAKDQKDKEDAEKKQKEDEEAQKAAALLTTSPSSSPLPSSQNNAEQTPDTPPDQTTEETPQITTSSSSNSPPLQPSATEITSLSAGKSLITSSLGPKKEGKILTVIATTEVVGEQTYLGASEYSAAEALVLFGTIIQGIAVILLVAVM